MGFKQKGKIVSISDIKEAGTGKKLSFRIDTGEQYNNLLEFELFKGAEYLEHLDNFKKYNNIGDDVEVEFNLKSYHWKKEGNDKVFISLGAWKVEKAENSTTQQTYQEQQLENNGGFDNSPLPF